ncbi:MAG: Rrf2 family transcriptional regulator [Candidatus Omnitrophica bacterium]|nr:Rrf2 family transcriptional regulator [Candidatus Omnitrophota bacterium]
MKLITRNSDYATGALIYLAQAEGRIVCADELVKELRIPQAFLRRLLQALVKNNILGSYKGKGGGFVLKLPPEKIGLSRIMRIFQGELKIVHCVLKKKSCPNKGRCILRARIKKIEKGVIGQLDAITLAALIGGKN